MLKSSNWFCLSSAFFYIWRDLHSAWNCHNGYASHVWTWAELATSWMNIIWKFYITTAYSPCQEKVNSASFKIVKARHQFFFNNLSGTRHSWLRSAHSPTALQMCDFRQTLITHLRIMCSIAICCGTLLAMLRAKAPPFNNCLFIKHILSSHLRWSYDAQHNMPEANQSSHSFLSRLPDPLCLEVLDGHIEVLRDTFNEVLRDTFCWLPSAEMNFLWRA